MRSQSTEFSWRTRERALKDFRTEHYDVLVVGGGITGAATARDAASRGLKVALVEKKDFAWGTSSRSSKLIHGGLRYLENMEFGLVFEALSERAYLLKTAPHMVRPLRFYLPVYEGDAHTKGILALGLWLYDLLALFRAPEFHKDLSREKFLKEIPFIKKDGLKGGFRYFDASMWDDGLVLENLRSAHTMGATVANYVEALRPVWKGDRVCGFTVRDAAPRGNPATFEIKASRVVVCGGPWTDLIGQTSFVKWTKWLKPSKGVHLIFDMKRIPVPGALVMSHPQDGRISFVIPRPDFGPGIVIVGTTDDDSGPNPESVVVEKRDVDYLLDLLNRYFPDLKLTKDDILNAYVGVRPLMGSGAESAAGSGLRKVSREHHIDMGHGGVVFVAGGKYTTHRTMAKEIVDFTLKQWKKDAADGKSEPYPERLGRGVGHSRTRAPVNPAVLVPQNPSVEIPKGLIDRFGGNAQAIIDIAREITRDRGGPSDPEGYSYFAAQLIHQMRTGMVIRLEDFFLRRSSVFLARRDHGQPWAEALAKLWAEEIGVPESAAAEEVRVLMEESKQRTLWRQAL